MTSPACPCPCDCHNPGHSMKHAQPCCGDAGVTFELAHVRELLADAYQKLSGRDLHASDCATACAPAETPKPCDCYPRVLFLSWPSDPADEPVGWLGQSAPTNDHFQCEFCGRSDLDCTLIPHEASCPVLAARAALSKATGEGASA